MENVLVQRQPSVTLDLVDTLGSARQKIEKFLSKQAQPMTPLQIARSTGLNENTVRRELQAMFKAGLVTKDMNHRYVRTNGNGSTPASASPNQPEPLKTVPATLHAPMPQAAPTTTVPSTPNEKAESIIPKLVAKLPKIKIEEILFVAYTTPAPMTRSAPLDERETIIYRVLSEDLADKLAELQSGFDREASKHLRTVVKGRLYFTRYPLETHKVSLEKLVEEWNKKYAEFAEELFAHREELEKAIADFYGRHNVTRRMHELDRAYLQNRFRVNIFMIPFSLRGGIVSEVVTDEEWRRITAQAKEKVIETYREEMNGQLSEFFASVKNLIQRLHDGKMVTAQNVAKLHRLYNEALEGLAVTQDERYDGTFDVMGNLISTLASKHEKHQSFKRNKDLAASIVAETLHVAKTIGTKAKPILEEFEAVLTAEKRPTKKTREGIREILEGLTLPA